MKQSEVGDVIDRYFSKIKMKTRKINSHGLSELLNDEELKIVEICKSDTKFAYENVDRIAEYLNDKSGCSLNNFVIIDILIKIISKTL